MINYNIATKARFLLLNKLVLKRREWQVMIDSRDTDISYLGKERLNDYRELMVVVVAATDFMQATPSSITNLEITLSDNATNFINDLTKFMLMDLSFDELQELLDHFSHCILVWSVGKEVDTLSQYDNNITTYKKAIYDALYNNLNYLVLILLVDLHHITFVEKAESCYEILLSTLKCYSIQGMG